MVLAKYLVVVRMKGTDIGCGSCGDGIKGWGNRVWSDV